MSVFGLAAENKVWLAVVLGEFNSGSISTVNFLEAIGYQQEPEGEKKGKQKESPKDSAGRMGQMWKQRENGDG